MSAQPTHSLHLTEVLFDEASFEPSMLDTAERLLGSPASAAGYLYVERPEACDLLLFYEGSLHSAARIRTDRISSLSLVEFLGGLRQGSAARVRLCRAEPGCVLLLAVVSQNVPTFKMETRTTALDRVLAEMKTRGTPATMVLRRGPELNVVYCRDGSPTAVFFADPANRLAGASARDEVISYDAARPGETQVAVITNLKSRRDEMAKAGLFKLYSRESRVRPIFLRVTQGPETLLRRLIQTGVATVGRDPANDIVLDDRSVSRKHCTFRWHENRVVVEDHGSANGILVNGIKLESSALAPGDRISVGDFDIIFGDQEASDADGELRTMFLDRGSSSGATAGPEPVAHLVYSGAAIAVDRAVFTLGKSAEANLRLSGFGMQPFQATIVREEGGDFRIVPADGGPDVQVDGHTVSAAGVSLHSTAQIKIGKHVLVFMLSIR